jgi:hypothetical protein
MPCLKCMAPYLQTVRLNLGQVQGSRLTQHWFEYFNI